MPDPSIVQTTTFPPDAGKPKNGTTGPAIDDLEARVEAARAARTTKQKAADDARRRRMLEEELKLSEIEEREGLLGRDFAAIFSPRDGSMVVVRKPTAALWQRFEGKILKDKQTVADLWDLLRGSLVYPDKVAFEAICDESPGMLSSSVNQIAALAGQAMEGIAGK